MSIWMQQFCPRKKKQHPDDDIVPMSKVLVMSDYVST